MGVEYELHDTKNRRRYDLGKRPFGGWFYGRTFDAIRDMGREAFIAEMVRVWTANLDPGDSIAKESAYATRVGESAWQFLESAEFQGEIRSDTTDWPDERYEWPVVGSRYDVESE